MPRRRLLLDVDSADFGQAAPLDPGAWRGWQAAAAERGRAALLTAWLPAAAEAARRAAAPAARADRRGAAAAC